MPKRWQTSLHCCSSVVTRRLLFHKVMCKYIKDVCVKDILLPLVYCIIKWFWCLFYGSQYLEAANNNKFELWSKFQMKKIMNVNSFNNVTITLYITNTYIHGGVLKLIQGCRYISITEVAEVLGYLHVQVSSISCWVVGSILALLGKNSDTAIDRRSVDGGGGHHPLYC